MERHPLRHSFLGAAHEYKAAAWFLNKHSNVFWPSLQQSDVDFVVEVKGELRKVQVKTATKNQRGVYAINFWRTKEAMDKAQKNFDWVVAVSRDGHLWVMSKADIQTVTMYVTVDNSFYAGVL